MIRRSNRTDLDRAPRTPTVAETEIACDAVLCDWRRTWCAMPEDDRPEWNDYVDGIGLAFVSWETYLRLTEGAE